MVPCSAIATALILFFPGFVPISDDEPSARAADQETLAPFAGLVGEWKGTGQVRRGSARGAWTESADWAWKLTKDSAALEMKAPGGKYLRDAVLRPGPEAGTFAMEATLSDGGSRRFAGKIGDRSALTLAAENPGDAAEGPVRITLTPLHDTRLLMLLEGPDPAGGLERLGEVGFTRQGVAFAAGDSAPVCIVTGGRGSMTVSYKGKTYPVCCSGCKDLFEDDPEAILAEAEAKREGDGK